MTKYRVVKEEKYPDEFVYVPQEWCWGWGGFVVGQSRMEFQTYAGAMSFLRKEVHARTPLSKPQVVYEGDTNSIANYIFTIEGSK